MSERPPARQPKATVVSERDTTPASQAPLSFEEAESALLALVGRDVVAATMYLPEDGHEVMLSFVEGVLGSPEADDTFEGSFWRVMPLGLVRTPATRGSGLYLQKDRFDCASDWGGGAVAVHGTHRVTVVVDPRVGPDRPPDAGEDADSPERLPAALSVALKYMGGVIERECLVDQVARRWGRAPAEECIDAMLESGRLVRLAGVAPWLSGASERQLIASPALGEVYEYRKKLRDDGLTPWGFDPDLTPPEGAGEVQPR